MDILQRKCVCGTLLGIKTDGNPLHISQIIHGTFLLKISERNMMMLLIKLHRRDRCRNLLHQRQLFPAVFFIRHIEGLLQHGTSKPSGIP